MSPRFAQIAYQIDRVARPILGITTILALLLMVIVAFDTPAKQILTYILYVVAAIWVATVLCRLVLSPFVITDEEENLTQKIDYILQKKQTPVPPSNPYSPLCHLSEEEERRVTQLLRTLPEHPDKPGHINLALVSQYLTALEKSGKAELRDKRRLRQWVAEVTGRQVPSSSQFNEAIPSKAATKVAAARKELETLLSQNK